MFDATYAAVAGFTAGVVIMFLVTGIIGDVINSNELSKQNQTLKAQLQYAQDNLAICETIKQESVLQPPKVGE